MIEAAVTVGVFMVVAAAEIAGSSLARHRGIRWNHPAGSLTARLACLAVASAALLAAFGPLVASQTVTAVDLSPGTHQVISEAGPVEHSSIVAQEGTSMLWVLLAPVAVAAVALVARGMSRVRGIRWVVGSVLLSFAVVSGFSVGFLYVPAAALGLVSAAQTPRLSRHRAPTP